MGQTWANQSQSEHMTKVNSTYDSAFNAFSVYKCLLRTFILISHDITTTWLCMLSLMLQKDKFTPMCIACGYFITLSSLDQQWLVLLRFPTSSNVMEKLPCYDKCYVVAMLGLIGIYSDHMTGFIPTALHKLENRSVVIFCWLFLVGFSFVLLKPYKSEWNTVLLLVF